MSKSTVFTLLVGLCWYQLWMKSNAMNDNGEDVTEVCVCMAVQYVCI
jgi:hypothetical protein